MKTRNKVRIANISTTIMIVTICLIVIWFVGFIVSSTFDLTVFARKTTTFMFSFLGSAVVLVFCSAILNISLNIGIIADSRVNDIKDEIGTSMNRKFYIGSLLIVVGVICFLFTADYLSRKKEQNKLEKAADYIIDNYKSSISKISPALSDNSQVKKVPEVLKFLSNQKEEFPSVFLITSDIYDSQETFLEITSWSSEHNLKQPMFGNSFYKCQDYDCEYLSKVFKENSDERLYWKKDNSYQMYVPITTEGKQFILVFTKRNRYGKIGS